MVAGTAMAVEEVVENNMADVAESADANLVNGMASADTNMTDLPTADSPQTSTSGDSNASDKPHESSSDSDTSTDSASSSTSIPSDRQKLRTSFRNVLLQDVYFALLALYVAHAPNELLFANIIRIINLLIPEDKERLPVKLNQFLSRSGLHAPSTKHFYCDRQACSMKYVGSADSHCTVCGSTPRKKSYFLYSSVQTYLSTLLRDNDLGQYLQSAVSNYDDRPHGVYEDVSDGSEFCRVQAASPGSIQLLLNVDGVPLYSTSSVALHPVTICPLNYPLAVRRKRKFCCLLWCDRRKPNYSEMLQPFVKEMRLLGTTGLFWHNGVQLINTKVFLTLVTADSVARAPLQHLQQFNGKYGCPVCVSPSTPLKATNALHRIYTYRPETILRTSAETLQIAKAKLVSS